MLFDLPLKYKATAQERMEFAQRQLSIIQLLLPDNKRHVWLIWEDDPVKQRLALKMGFGAYDRLADAAARCRLLNRESVHGHQHRDEIQDCRVYHCEKYDNPAFVPCVERQKEKKVKKIA